MDQQIFKSFLMGGFECSTHRNCAGKRLDVIASTQHERLAREDYARLLSVNIRTARDGTRWHLIEKKPYVYDWSSVANQIAAASETGVQIIWDLFHYGYPDDLDIFSREFIERFSEFAVNFVAYLAANGDEKPIICLVNEISFFAWAGGQVAYFNPLQQHRGDELKRQLVKASIAAAMKIRQVVPAAVLIQTDPVIRVTAAHPKHQANAANHHEAQFHALDAFTGKANPELGGNENLIDCIGINYYPYNQWRHPSGRKILRGHKNYHPFSEIVCEFYERYRKPLFVAETGTEDDARAEWFEYIWDEVEICKKSGVPILGICLYPIVNHPGWDDDRHCHNGLWDYPNETGERRIYEPLARAILRKTNSAAKAETA